jgi:replicative DNA helicase
VTDREPLPPHDSDAEQALLGSLLIDRDAIAGVVESLKPEAFFLSANATIYRAMLGLWAVRRPCDLVTLSALLASRGKLDEVGGAAYLSALMASVPTAVHLHHYADIVNEHARRRALIDAGSMMVATGYAKVAEPDYDRMMVDARSSISAFDPLDRPADEQVDALIDNLRQTTFKRWSGDYVDDTTPSGIEQIDRLTGGGMRRRELWVIAARPSMGKSALMLHMARRTRALIFSLEMPTEQVLNRMICAEAGVPYQVAYQQVGDLDQRNRWLAASERLEKLTGMIVDKPGMTTARIEAITSRAIAEHGINAVYIDHLNYLNDQFRYSNEQEKTGELVRRCKQIANVCDVPVVLISQLNREAESREGCMPRMSDLRSSGRIEEDADFVGLLYRRLYYVNKGMIDAKVDLDWVTASNWQKVQLMVAKNRNGETGTAWLGWEAASMRFHEVAAA